MEQGDVVRGPGFPKGVDPRLGLQESASQVSRRSRIVLWGDDARLVGGERRVEDVGGCQCFAVVDSRRYCRQGTPVENSFNLNEDRVERFHVDVVAESQSRQMFLE